MHKKKEKALSCGNAISYSHLLLKCIIATEESIVISLELVNFCNQLLISGTVLNACSVEALFFQLLDVVYIVKLDLSAEISSKTFQIHVCFIAEDM